MLGAMMRRLESIFFNFFLGALGFRPCRTPWGIDGPGIAPHRTSTPRSAAVGAAIDHRMGWGADRPRHALTSPRAPTTCANPSPGRGTDTI